MIKQIILQFFIGYLSAIYIPFIAYLLDERNVEDIGWVLTTAYLSSFTFSYTLSKIRSIKKYNKTLYLSFGCLSLISSMIFEKYGFEWISVTGNFIFFNPILGILDNFTLESIDRKNYNYYRATASTTWGITAFGVTRLLSDQNICFYFYTLGILVSCIFIIFTQSSSNISQLDSISEDDKDNPSLLILYFLMFSSTVYSFSMTYIGSYFIIFVRDIVEVDNDMLSIRQLIAVSLEIPTFLAYSLIKRFIGDTKCLLLSILFIILQMTGYFFITSFYQVLLVESLHGVSYALFWASCLNIIYGYKDSGRIHILFWSFFSGLGVALALSLGYLIPLFTMFSGLIFLNILSLGFGLIIYLKKGDKNI